MDGTSINQVHDFWFYSDAKYQDDWETKRWIVTVDECKVTGKMEK